MTMMLRTGNPGPVPGIGSRRDFISLLEEREFRGALAVDDISGLVAPNGHLMGVRFSYFGSEGVTPLRLSPRRPGIPSGGRGNGDYRYEVSEQEVTLTAWWSFKVGRFVDFGQSLLTGTRATSATLKIEYKINCSCDFEATLIGSSIPSQSHYLRWGSRSDYYSMFDASEAEIRGFCEAGGCVTAPVQERTTVRGRCTIREM
jgi:hypothetical protein